MKKTRLIKLSGNIGTILLLIGAMFKIQHYPFQNELLTIGLLLFAVFWIWILVEIFKLNRSLIYKTIWTIIVVIIPLIGSWIYYHLELKRIKTTGNNVYTK
jgi:hypothetical protein